MPASPQSPEKPNAFGAAMKDWRARRRLSQLDLALTAGVSARHVAFLETGRSRPSREMVIALSEAMTVPLRERNALLTAAGFAPIYAERRLSDAALAPVRAAYEALLAKHDPYPAVLFDRHWTIVSTNVAARAVLGLPPQPEGVNIIRMLAGNPLTPQLIANWPEVAHDLRDRLRLEARAQGHDPALEELIALMEEDPALARPRPQRRLESSPFVGARLKTERGEITMFSTIAEFGTVEDITVRDLRLELFFPADADSARVLTEIASS
jgi:transcriptional regulator with XRE-family HTH domain